MNWRTRWLSVFVVAHFAMALVTLAVTTADSFKLLNTPPWKWLLYFATWRGPGAAAAVWLVLGTARIDLRCAVLLATATLCTLGLYAPWSIDSELQPSENPILAWIVYHVVLQAASIVVLVALLRLTVLRRLPRAADQSLPLGSALASAQFSLSQLFGLTAVAALAIVLVNSTAALESVGQLSPHDQIQLIRFAADEAIAAGTAILAILPWRRHASCLYTLLPAGSLFCLNASVFPLSFDASGQAVHYAYLAVSLFVLRLLGLRVAFRRPWFWPRSSPPTNAVERHIPIGQPQ